MTEDQRNNKQHVQMAVSAKFSTTLVPTDIELGTPVEIASPPLAEPDASSVEAIEEISESPPLSGQDDQSSAGVKDTITESRSLVQQDENTADAKNEIDELVRDVRNSTTRTLELSKRLDDMLARPIRWFQR